MNNETALSVVIFFGQGLALYVTYLYLLAWRWGVERPTLESMAKPIFAIAWLLMFPVFRSADPGFPPDLAFISTAMFVSMLAFMANGILRQLLAKTEVVKIGPLLYFEGRGWV